MKNWFLVTFFFLSISTVFAQGKITGMVQDENGPLPGANIVIEGTSVGTTSDFDGGFSINTTAASGKVVISFLGFATKKLSFEVSGGKTIDFGKIVLSAEGNILGEIVVKSTVVDIAKDRKTPVASSTIKASEIKEKIGNLEIPEMLANTPSVYATKSGGGFGDSRISVRGFSQENVAVMVNGVPVNDMENSRVFWSNWAGLSDVTSAMQVQRGLGSSKLAISSVGGTINFITRTSDMKEGGSISATLANNDYIKTIASYSTGKLSNGFSASILLGNSEGNMYADGTQFSAKNYFIGLGYEFNEKHDIQFTFTGAPQWHNARSFANTIADHIKYGDPVNREPNIKYNSDWGYYKGKQFSWATNFYHKPVMSLNYDWKINSRMKLSSVFYGSWGRGGQTASGSRSPFNFKTANGLVPFNDFYAYNTGTYSAATREAVTAISGPSNLVPTNGQQISSRSTGFTRTANINSHDWYGAVINLNTKLTDKLTLDFGADLRTYTGYHFRMVNDRLGAVGYNANLATGAGGVYVANDINNPTNQTLYQTYEAEPSLNPFVDVKDMEKIEYNNNGLVRWYGAFTQLEYTTEKLSAFVQGGISQQGFKKQDFFTYLKTDPLHETDYENILGGNVKGGANYNLNEQMNVFANAGYYSKQPFFNAVYPNNRSKLNENLTNEKILGIEAGYGFKSSKFNAKLNLYYTSWKDRYQRSTDSGADNVGGYYDFAGITEIHSGVELELNANPLPKLGLNAMFSMGNWEYKGNSTSRRFDANNEQISGGTSSTMYLDGVKVGDVAQTTASFGANYEIVRNLKIDGNYRFADNLFSRVSPTNFFVQNHKGSLELPSYGLVDGGLSFKIHRVKDSKDYFNLRVNVNNVLDEVYIAEGRSNIFADDKVSTAPGAPTYEAAGRTYKGVADANTVYFGFGRTWNFGVTYNF